MKKVIFSAAIFFAAISVNAQDAYSAGSIMATGGIGFNSGSSKTTYKTGGSTTTADGPKITGFNLNLMGGYFIADRIAVGLGLGLQSSKMVNEGSTTTYEDKMSLTTVAPFVRWYAPEITSDFSLFVDFAVGFGFGKDVSKETSGGTTETETIDLSALSTGFSPGFSYLVTDNIALNLKWGFLGYTSMTSSADLGGGDSAKRTDSSFGLDLDLTSVNVGFSFFF